LRQLAPSDHGVQVQAEGFATQACSCRLDRLENFDRAWTKIQPQFINTFIITIPSTLLSVGIGALAAYSISRLRFVGSELLYLASSAVSSSHSPARPTLVNMLDQLRLYDTFCRDHPCSHGSWQMLMVFLPARFFQEHPRRNRGCRARGRLLGAGLLWRIIAPLSTPALAAGVILQFTWIWNDFFKAPIIVPTSASAPVTVALQGFTGQYATEIGYRSAASLIAALPSLVVSSFSAVLHSRITSGALKG